MTTNDFFQPWPKTARLSRNMIVTEKLDGTNAQVYIHDERFLIDTEVKGVQAQIGKPVGEIPFLYSNDGIHIAAGSRNKWITPEQDNHGFARWVRDCAPALAALGHGRHFGEWWGQGIQRTYGLSEKRFSLFNTRRWCLHGTEPKPIPSNNPVAEVKMQQPLPEMVGLVPVLYEGEFCTIRTEWHLEVLKKRGSVAAPGFMNPEGICIFHEAAQIVFKKTIKDDANPKSV
jgi:hypothetical protein